METKKDIYNLWIQYTTKNDETFFRQFIYGFVQIWENQLNIDFDKPPLWNTIKSDLGPHLSRLPDELLPAIGKFLIIAKDSVQQNGNIQPSKEELDDTTLLIKCLIVMCRHFENINTIANYEYISSIITLSINIIQLAFKNNVKPTISEIQLIKSACQLIEVIYDPYLTWRNFLHGNYAQHTKINSSLCQLHVEIVPFIYDCFQSEKILNLPEIGINLINTLGSIISGSQNCLSSVNKTTQTTHCSSGGGSGGGSGGFGVGGDTNISWHNGMRAISPATVTMLIDLISKWECNSELRLISLKCYAIMAIVLQRSSPVERQIELVTICQFYLNVIQTLMTTKHFLPKPIEEKFEISNNQDDLSYIDVNAFISFIDNIEIILSEKHSQLILCSAIIECNIFSTLTLIMMNVNTWDIDLQSLASSIIRCICFLTRISPQMCNLLHNFHNMEQLFNGLQLMGKPTQKLLNVCLKLTYNDEKLEIIFGNVIIKLLEWIKNMHENEQIYLSENLLKICLQNFYCKTIVSQEQIIKTICKTLQNYNSLNSKCAIDLIKLIEEIGKYSISSIELKNIFWLLRNEMHFIYRRQLLQAVATISLNNISNSTICNEFLDIQYKTDGITVPEIRKWTMSGSYGYIFHAWIRFDILNGKDNDNISNDTRNFRRVILSTLTNQGHGFEIFLQRNGQLTVGVLTKKEYLAAAVTKVNMLDNRWHLITIGIIPSKRPFSFTQISVYIDGLQKLGATFKFAGITEPFSYCTIGRISHEITKQSRSSFSSQLSDSSDCSSPIPSDSPKSGMFPSFIDRSFIPQIVSQVPNYFSLPRSTSSNDPNIKAYPIGMQNNVFGEPMCLKGQLGCMVLAEPNTNIKLILDAGYNFATVISQDIEPYDPTSKFIFCYSPISCYDGFCIDLVPGNKYNGHVVAKFCRTIKIQDSINSIGGIYTLLPILDIITKSKENIDILFTNDNNNNSSSPKEVLTPTSSSNNDVDINDWEVLVSTKYSEWKMIQNSVACFLCLIRYFIQDHDINQAHLLKSDGISIIGAMLSQCNSNIIDVNVLMAMQLLVESIQNQIPAQNVELLENMYTDIVFNFKIWSKCEFQIIIGHIQYINPMIKDNRKYFRNKFGIQYFLDIIRQYFAIPINLSPDDGLAIRMALLDIIKYYLQKDINIKEVNIILSYIASLKYEHLIVEILELLINYMKYKTCKDQLFLLLHEPQTAEILYILLIDKSYSNELHLSLLRFFHCLLETNRVSKKHKSTIRLHDSQVDSLYPGLFSFMLPFNLNNTNALNLIDQILTDDTEKSMSGLLYIIHHLSTANINLKLEITQRLLPLTFDKSIAYFIAKQIGWQETIPRLLIKKHITNTGGNINKTKTDNDAIGTGSGGDSDGDITSYEDNNDLLNQMDLMTFDEKTLELSEHERIKDHHLLLTEFQASVSEAANVIEHEIKGMAETVAGKVGENISSVYSMLRQTTCDIQEHIETAIGAPIDSKLKSYSSFSTQSSDSTSEENIYTKSIDKDDGNKSLNNDESIANKEENLIYLVTNILFNVLWNGIDNNNNDAGDLWKQRGQVIASINLLGLNNELYCSHLKLRLRILEMGIQSVLKDLNEAGHNVQHQQNASQLLRLVYDLMILDPTEDEMDKCSELLFEGILHLFDALMIFPKSGTDDWSEMTRLCLGLLLKCSHHPNSEIVAKATARLHEILQSRSTQNPQEFGYLIYSVNRVLNVAIEVGNPEQYSYLMPIMRALLDKSRYIFSLSVNVPGLPKTESGPTFFHEFQMYGCTKEWIHFVERKLKPLYDSYQNDVNTIISEPLNTFWAECYESCKLSSQKRAKLLTDSRRRFQQKIMMPWKIRKNEENTRLNGISSLNKTKENQVERRWKSIKRFLHGSRGAWSYDIPKEEYWRHSNHENSSRMRLKLEPSLYHDTHISASNLRDNTANNIDTRRLSTEFGSSITQAVIQDMLTEDEVILLEEEMKNIAENQQQEISVEKIVISQECELVSLMTRIKGRLEVTSRMFIFIDLNPKEDGEKYDFRFPITQIKEVHLRKFNLCRSALEIFLINQTSYFLNFTPKTRNKIFTKILSLQPPNILYGSGRSPSELLKASGLTQRWMNREISNFEYLMHLNTIAGRSYNDLSQYPIFPWILSDYTSEILDLTNPSSFRDLSKPIGVVNSKNEKEVRAKYESFEDPSGIIPRFHYGTHYSNSAGVLHYLIRVEPFTSLHIELQSGRFDVADRQFHSIPQTFKLLMDNANDVKELIPEFFYFPEFLKNMNKFDLGILQVTKERVDDVILPPWANTPEDFIEIHRRALESEYVSQNLHNWIDLIFGYKQKGPKAVEALNVFYYCSYEGAVDLDKIENQAERLAVEGMINNFGQTPSQLLREPHPKRLTHEEALIKLLRQELRKSEFTSYLDRIISTTCELSTDKNPIVFLSVPRSPPRSFLQTNPDVLVAISKNGILGCNSWLSHDKENGFHIELDPTTTNIKNRKKLGGPFHPAINLHSQLFAVSLDGRYLYAGGIWDNSLKVFNVNRGKNVASITHHLDIITCLALDNCGSFLVTGSKDCTCIVWSLNNTQSLNNSNINNNININQTTQTSGAITGHTQANTNNSLTPRPLNTLYGHDSTVSCVAIMTELDIVVSGSIDGTVNVHTIIEGQYVRTLSPMGCTGLMIEITYLALSYQGHIAFSALDDTSHSVHVYSINGSHLGSKYVSGRVTGLTTASDFLVVSDDAGDITLSRLYGLKPVFDIPLHIPIQTVIVTPGNTHILAPLRDGKLAVIGISTPTPIKKHSVLNV